MWMNSGMRLTKTELMVQKYFIFTKLGNIRLRTSFSSIYAKNGGKLIGLLHVIRSKSLLDFRKRIIIKMSKPLGNRKVVRCHYKYER